MTAFTKDDIPASIDTVEKLVIWGASLLNYLNPSATGVEGTSTADAVTVRSVQFSPYFMTATDTDQHWNVIARQSIRLDPQWQSGSKKIWNYALEISGVATPVEFKS